MNKNRYNNFTKSKFVNVFFCFKFFLPFCLLTISFFINTQKCISQCTSHWYIPLRLNSIFPDGLVDCLDNDTNLTCIDNIASLDGGYISSEMYEKNFCVVNETYIKIHFIHNNLFYFVLGQGNGSWSANHYQPIFLREPDEYLPYEDGWTFDLYFENYSLRLNPDYYQIMDTITNKFRPIEMKVSSLNSFSLDSIIIPLILRIEFDSLALGDNEIIIHDKKNKIAFQKQDNSKSNIQFLYNETIKCNDKELKNYTGIILKNILFKQKNNWVTYSKTLLDTSGPINCH